MKYYGTISDPKDLVTKEYVDGQGGGGLTVDDIYPIGSIYMSVNSTSPSTLFPGTYWEQISDTFLLAAGTNHAAGTTGGSETVTLTSAQSGVPAHDHGATGLTVTGGATTNAGTSSDAAWGFRSSALLPRTGASGLVGVQTGVTVSKSSTQRYSISSNSYTTAKSTGTIDDTVNFAAHSHKLVAHSHTVGGTTADNTAQNASSAHENMPPYLAVYVWKRVAPAASYNISYEEHTRSAYNLISLSANGSQAADGEWAESAMSGNTIVMVFSGWWQPIITRTDTSEEIACTKTETIINPNRRTVWTFTMPDSPIYVNEWYND